MKSFRTIHSALVALVVLSVGVGCLLYIRTVEIRNAHDRTTAFCRSVSVGDDLIAVVERVKPGAAQLGAVVDAHVVPASKHEDQWSTGLKDRLNVIFETRDGQQGWPRYVIWSGPAYDRVYCSLESTSDARIKAVHLGAVDDASRNPGFIESMIEDWVD